MREGRDNGFEFGNDGLIALNLGSDHVAEHEIGIAPIKQSFGIEPADKTWGLKRRVTTRRPENLMWLEGKAYGPIGKRHGSVRVRCVGFSLNYIGEAWMPNAVHNENGLYTAWDYRAFAAYSVEEKGIERLRELYDAFEVCNVALWLGGGHVFHNPGLVLAIATRLPTQVLQDWLKHDKDKYELDQEVAASGIKDKLEKAGCDYFALSPKRESNGSISFWLNPRNQHLYESGWFTLGELEQWVEGKGKIMKVRKGHR